MNAKFYLFKWCVKNVFPNLPTAAHAAALSLFLTADRMRITVQTIKDLLCFEDRHARRLLNQLCECGVAEMVAFTNSADARRRGPRYYFQLTPAILSKSWTGPRHVPQ